MSKITTTKATIISILNAHGLAVGNANTTPIQPPRSGNSPHNTNQQTLSINVSCHRAMMKFLAIGTYDVTYQITIYVDAVKSDGYEDLMETTIDNIQNYLFGSATFNQMFPKISNVDTVMGFKDGGEMNVASAAMTFTLNDREHFSIDVSTYPDINKVVFDYTKKDLTDLKATAISNLS